MHTLRVVIITLVLAGSLAGCVVRPAPYYWHTCYRCW